MKQLTTTTNKSETGSITAIVDSVSGSLAEWPVSTDPGSKSFLLGILKTLFIIKMRAKQSFAGKLIQ